MWGASTAQASLILDLSIEYSGATPPEGTPPWLNATFNGSGGEVTLTLSTTNLTDNENVKEWAFNLAPNYDPTNLLFTEVSALREGSFSTPDITTGTNFWRADGDGYFDILIEFSNKDGLSNRFGVGDRIVYTITGTGMPTLAAESFDFISETGGGSGEYETAAHVGGIGPTDDDSGWVATPEPATLAVLALGLLLSLLRKRKA